MNSNANIIVPRSVLDTGMRYAEVSSALIKKATDELSVRHAVEKRAEAIAPDLLKYMVEKGIVPKEHEKAAEAMLGAHDTTLNLLRSAAERIHEYEQKCASYERQLEKTSSLNAGLGGPEPGAKDTASQPLAPYSQVVRESDKPLLSLIGK